MRPEELDALAEAFDRGVRAERENHARIVAYMQWGGIEPPPTPPNPYQKPSDTG